MIATKHFMIEPHKFLIMFYFILRFGSGSLLFGNVNPIQNPEGFCLYLFVAFYLLVKSRKYIKHILNNIIVGLAVMWVIIHRILDPSFAPFNHILFILDIILGLSIAYYYKETLILYYEKILVILSGVSIMFWLILISFGTSVFPRLFKGMAFGNDCWSLLIFTVNNISSSDLYFNIIRNPGFAWEPGIFASMVVIAIVFNILKNKGEIIIKSKSFIILLLALLTTFSTTGYTAFFAVIVLHYINKSSLNLFKRILILFAILVSSLYIYNLPFISDKIEKYSNSENYLSNGNLNYWESEGKVVTVQRFEGLELDLLNIFDKPLAGYGVDRTNSFVGRTISESVITSNGLLKPFAMFGVLLALPIFVCFYLSSKKISVDFNYSNYRLVFLSILILSVSYDLFQAVIIHSLQFYYFARQRSVKLKVLDNR